MTLTPDTQTHDAHPNVPGGTKWSGRQRLKPTFVRAPANASTLVYYSPNRTAAWQCTQTQSFQTHPTCPASIYSAHYILCLSSLVCTDEYHTAGLELMYAETEYELASAICRAPWKYLCEECDFPTKTNTSDSSCAPPVTCR